MAFFISFEFGALVFVFIAIYTSLFWRFDKENAQNSALSRNLCITLFELSGIFDINFLMALYYPQTKNLSN